MRNRKHRRESRRDLFFQTLEQKHPLLNWLLRVARYNSWFWLAGLALLAVFSTGAVFVMKQWAITPAGFQPVVRARGIDLFRARALRNSATKQDLQGRADEAIQTWLMSLANNPADTKSLRGVLLHLSKGPANERNAQLAQGFGGWLIKLRGTNESDLTLVSEVFEKQGLDQMLVPIFKGSTSKLTPSLEAAYLKALFNSGDAAGFDSEWKRLSGKAPIARNKSLQLYRAAYFAGWGSDAENYQGFETLKEAKKDPAFAELAHRLQLRVSSRTLDAASCLSSIDYLAKNSHVELKDQIGYWKILVGLGRRAEAGALIRANDKKPVSSGEAIELAKTCFSAGLNEEAGAVLKTYSEAYPASESLWTSYTSWLVEQKRWELLRSCAVVMRSLDNPLHRSLAGYGRYLEARAELGLGRRETAEMAIAALPQESFENKSIAVLVAVNLIKLGYADSANKLLSQLEPALSKDPHYWTLLSKTAYDLHDANLLRYAIEKSYQLQPEDPSTINNYAALLLSFREKPEVAIQLTLRLMALYPGSVSVRINHICALLRNKRTAEAEQLLTGVPVENLTPMDVSSYYMAVFEAAVAHNDSVAALKASKHIDRTFLIGPDKAWFESTLDKMVSMN